MKSKGMISVIIKLLFKSLMILPIFWYIAYWHCRQNYFKSSKFMEEN